MEHKKSEYPFIVAVLLVGVFILSLQSLAAVSAHASRNDNVRLQSITETIQPTLIAHGSLINATFFLAGPFDQNDDPRMRAFVENLRIRATNYATSYGRGEANEEMRTETTTSTSIYTAPLKKANSSSLNNFDRTPNATPLFSLFVLSNAQIVKCIHTRNDLCR